MRKLFYNVTVLGVVQKADTYSQALKNQEEYGGRIYLINLQNYCKKKCKNN